MMSSSSLKHNLHYWIHALAILFQLRLFGRDTHRMLPGSPEYSGKIVIKKCFLNVVFLHVRKIIISILSLFCFPQEKKKKIREEIQNCSWQIRYIYVLKKWSGRKSKTTSRKYIYIFCILFCYDSWCKKYTYICIYKDLFIHKNWYMSFLPFF